MRLRCCVHFNQNSIRKTKDKKKCLTVWIMATTPMPESQTFTHEFEVNRKFLWSQTSQSMTKLKSSRVFYGFALHSFSLSLFFSTEKYTCSFTRKMDVPCISVIFPHNVCLHRMHYQILYTASKICFHQEWWRH